MTGYPKLVIEFDEQGLKRFEAAIQSLDSQLDPGRARRVAELLQENSRLHEVNTDLRAKLAAAVAAFRRYANRDDWSYEISDRFDIWLGDGDGFDEAQKALEKIGE